MFSGGPELTKRHTWGSSINLNFYLTFIESYEPLISAANELQIMK